MKFRTCCLGSEFRMRGWFGFWFGFLAGFPGCRLWALVLGAGILDVRVAEGPRRRLAAAEAPEPRALVPRVVVQGGIVEIADVLHRLGIPDAGLWFRL